MTSTPDDITIEEIDLDRVTHDDLGRVYYNEHVTLPSVSTVLGVRPTPPALQRHIEKQKQKDGYTEFALDRGTLGHYRCLNPLAEEELWSEDEQSSKDTLQQHQEYWDKYQSGLDWIDESWELIKEIRGIDEGSVLAVEHFVANFEVGYGGQLDLLWVDPDGDVVVGDLKFSKDIYDKYLFQPVAYGEALDITVDHHEIIRMQPEHKVWEVSRSDEWIEDTDDLWEEFKGYREQLEEERIQRIREEAEQTY